MSNTTDTSVTAIDAHQLASADIPADLTEDRVLNFHTTAKVLDRSYDEFRRLLKAGNGPTLTRISDNRFGIRVRHLRAWLDSRAVAPGQAA